MDDMVVFHLPDLSHELEKDLDKPEGRKGVAWSVEYEDRNDLLSILKFSFHEKRIFV